MDDSFQMTHKNSLLNNWVLRTPREVSQGKETHGSPARSGLVTDECKETQNLHEAGYLGVGEVEGSEEEINYDVIIGIMM